METKNYLQPNKPELGLVVKLRTLKSCVLLHFLCLLVTKKGRRKRREVVQSRAITLELESPGRGGRWFSPELSLNWSHQLFSKLSAIVRDVRVHCFLSDDDGEIDVIEGLTDNKGNSEADEDNSGPDNEDNSEIDRSSGDSDANNEDEDSDDQANTNGQTFVSKNKQVWHAAPVKLSQGRLGQQNILREKSGPTRYANREVDSIYSAFLIFFREPLMKIIVKWINVEGNTVFGNRWKEIDQNELQKFVGVLILIGAYKSRNEEISQLWSKKDGRKIFNDIMSRNRFQNILRVISNCDKKLRKRRNFIIELGKQLAQYQENPESAEACTSRRTAEPPRKNKFKHNENCCNSHMGPMDPGGSYS
ncbi:Transposase IS4 [Popillia japonica]|uniref:Transposase IS4 n=1 Tax=Popillia japonica TaxID=7064 RepID=A0AAW1JJE9_POPJA